MPHLVVDLSAHGYGHLALTAPVVNELARRRPTLKVTIRCAASREVLFRRFECQFAHVSKALDFGMIMKNAMDVDVAASARAYADFHRNWDRRVAQEAQDLAALAPDLLLANVPYLSLAAAARAGIKSAALCPLNWADIYFPYCAELPGAAQIRTQMLDAYNTAECFIKPQPAMSMLEIAKGIGVGPIARIGLSRRAEIRGRLNLGDCDKLILIALGGMPLRLPVDTWPRIARTRWLVPEAWNTRHPDAVPLESLALHFTDLLASCDAVITKPGYGTFTEAACIGVPTLYLARPDWPEAPYLVDWLKANARCLEVERAQLERGEIGSALDTLLALPAKAPVQPSGIEEAADILERMLSPAQ